MSKITFQNKVDSISNTVPLINKVIASDINEIKESVNTLYDIIPSEVTEYIIVGSLDDLPDAVGGIISLAENTAYFFVKTIDLLGSRLIGDSNTTLLGTSSETSIITSTGLGVGVPLFSTEFTTPIRHIAFKDVDTALSIQGSANSAAFDWTGLNIVNVPNIGILDGGDNFILSKSAFINSQNLVFTGTWNTIGIDNSLFSGDGTAGNVIELDLGCIINRRFRIIYSAVISFSSSVGLFVSPSSTIPIEGYILDTVSFSGGGTYLGGLESDSIYSLFINCTGITNSYTISNYFMNSNVTVTDIISSGVAVKVAGTTTSNSLTQKFTNTSNRATYTGGFSRIFNITAIASITSSSSNDQIGLYVAKNGTIISSSEVYLTTNASNRAENITIQTIVELATGDYIEIFVENSTDTSDLTVTDLNVLIKSIS